jgi:DNA phosphorothioation-dependent restriction protein DptG
MLHDKYVSIAQVKESFVHKISPINKAILKSHHHIHSHFDTSICKKKNKNIPSAQQIPFNIAKSDKFTPK